MRIGLDVSQIVYKGTGVSRYTEGLINAILDFKSNDEWLFFFSSRPKFPSYLERKIKEGNFKLIKLPIPPRVLSFLFNDLHKIKIDWFTGKLDWFITSDWTEPPSNCKKATIVHDLAFVRYPEVVHPLILKTQKKRFKWVKKESKIIFADSHATKKDLVSLLSFEEERVKVVYPGVDIMVEGKSKDNEKILRRYNLRKKKYLLSVGKIEPRKNIKRLIQSFLGSPLLSSRFKLVIVGPSGWENLSNLKMMKGKNVIFTGYLSDKDLFALYKDAFVFVMPSLWEGFGYPVVEAMKFGVPVAVSNNSSLVEIVNDSALKFDPYDINSIKEVLERLVRSKKLYNDLKKKVRLQAAKFEWKKSVKSMVKILHDYRS